MAMSSIRNSMSRQDKKAAKELLKRYSEHEFVHKSDRVVFKTLLKEL